jgi:DNA repair protein RecO (recombination protein O)
MIQKTKGIVLHSIKYGDSSLIAHIYTENFGRHSFLFKGIRSNKSKIRSNLLQPLFILTIEAYIKEGKDLSLVKEVSAQKIFTHFPYDFKKSAQAMFMAEILYRCLREEEVNSPLFDFICSSIDYFDLLSEGSANFHILFLVKLSKYLGFYPSSREIKNELVFDIQEGIYKDHIPTHFDYIDPLNSALLDEILNTNYENLQGLKLNKEKRNDLLDGILKFYSFQIEGIANLKSYTVLREIFI